MPKIKNYVQKQNLSSMRTWIDDIDPSSRYFQVSQVPELLTGGKNAFLIAGSPELIRSTEVRMEIIDVDGNTIFLQPIRKYQEGQSRVISIEVYEDTPPGPATLTILGQVARDAKGNIPPDEFKQAYNVRWQKTLIVAPQKPNSSPIRLYQRPELGVNELLVPFKSAVTGSTLVLNTGSISLISLVPRTNDINTNIITTVQASGFEFVRNMQGGIFAALIDGIPYSTSIDQIFNKSTARLNTGFNGNIPLGYQTNNFSIRFSEETQYVATALSRSFADINLSKLTTFSGDIARAKIYVRSLDQPGDYQSVADIRLEASELTVTQSLNTGQQDIRLGYFYDQPTIDSYWNTGKVFADSYHIDNSVSASYSMDLLLDAAHIVNEPTESLFFGLKNPLTFYSGLEYTLSGSFYGLQTNVNTEAKLDIYLIGEAFPSTSVSPLGYKIASYNIPAGFGSRRFDGQSINFRAQFDGDAYLRFVIDSGDWFYSNIRVISSAETGFNPDQVRIVTPISNRRFEQLQFKAELYDVNSNLVPIIIESVPQFFDGGNYVFKGTDHRVEGGISILSSGSNPSTAIKLIATGFKNGTQFIPGSAIVIGSGSFFNANTPFLVGSTNEGKPFISIADKLRGYIDESTNKFVLDIEGDILVGSGSSKFDVRSLLPRKSTIGIFDRVIAGFMESNDVRGINSVTAGAWNNQIARMGKYTRGIDGYVAQLPVSAPPVSSSVNPFITGSLTLFTSGTIDIPLDQKVYNDTLYGDINISISNTSITSMFILGYEVGVATSWSAMPSASAVGQTLVSENSIYASQIGSYSPDPMVKYPIPIPDNRDSSTTLYYLVKLKVSTSPTV